MKKLLSVLCLFVIFIYGCTSNYQPTSEFNVVNQSTENNNGLTLDQALKEAVERISERVARGSRIALLNFNSTSERLSSYVLDELTANIIDNGNYIVVNRSEIDPIGRELNFQYSGEVADDSMQTIGRRVSAHSIISGSLTDMGGFYRIVIRVLNVQNGTIEVQYRTNIVSDHVIMALLTGGSSSVVAMVPGSGQQFPSTQNQTQQVPQAPVRPITYRIGDTGPAGGIIFYDKGIFSNGWRYLEAAPFEYEFQAQWGLTGQTQQETLALSRNISTDIGRGKINTEALVSNIRGRREIDRAAELCTILEVNGFNDWFLPSYDELNLLYVNLKQRNLGHFQNNWYWSSSIMEHALLYVWRLNFGNGRRENYLMLGSSSDQAQYVRAIRQF